MSGSALTIDEISHLPKGDTDNHGQSQKCESANSARGFFGLVRIIKSMRKAVRAIFPTSYLGVLLRSSAYNTLAMQAAYQVSNVKISKY